MQDNQNNETMDDTMAIGSDSSETPKLTPDGDMQTNKILAIASHLGPLTGVGFIILPAIIWYVYKEKNNAFVAEHAKQAMFYQALVGIFGMVFGVFTFAASMLTAGLAAFVLVPASLLLSLVVLIPSLIASYKAMNAENYNYPVSGAMSKKF